MNFEQLIESMTPDIYQTMKTSVEIGKWPDGTPLTQEQKEAAIRAVMVYDAQNSDEHSEPFRVQPDGSVRLGKEPATRQLIDNDPNVIIKTKASDQ